MSNPTTRVLALLELLQIHDNASGSELAQMLGVDGRTLRRYIATLEEIGIPLTAERGRYGGYRLVSGYKLPPMMFTNEETLAISLGLLAARSLSVGEVSTAVASAQAKLERVMPQKLKQQLRALGDSVTLDLVPSSAPDSVTLATLAAATQNRCRTVFDYTGGSGNGKGDGSATRREFDPYGLVFRRGRWYAVGHCHLRADLRTFRLDRMQQLRRLEIPFQRPQDFDAAAYLTSSFASMDSGIEVELLLHTDLANASAVLGDELGLLTPKGDAVLWRAHTGCLNWFATQLVRLPFTFEILTPSELRGELRRQAEKLLGIAMA
ncbi:Predicted DNA-binding transcriptional regulator YafY, contains an HTH and WYL domains [Microbulbifer donghaiensis]|uniref:Predicted DNA-binding transcriptional regulator YafY, contains an HTH and WYL domains n=1 Tax=Microbulbifer donghaiensis TaxID=494016 RepID=A0A1M5FP27_9GAMM|nr:YafY family protein [Microbulbifer donghaiensis]SHF93179.1 Predicted DNA-binding transcriptional regulator YafY, contains an HTH and WYL domains [Microbulbifer donghaiensis]